MGQSSLDGGGMKSERLLVAFLLGAFLCPSGIAVGQDVYSIHVDPHQVLVPVFVYDKTRMTDPPPFPPHICPLTDAKDSNDHFSVPENCDDAEIVGLGVSDFHLFEDGKEQKIQSVGVEHLHHIDIHDNLGVHDEDSNTPRGKWSTSDLPRMLSGPVSNAHFYLVSYVPPQSAENSCHQIKVKVDRHNDYVYARSQYCNTKHSASDPLNGTKFGTLLEDALFSGKPGNIALAVQVGLFRGDADAVRVDIALEFPWNSLKREWDMATLYATIGVLGMFEKTDGTLVARFSDLGCCPRDRPFFYTGPHPNESHPEQDIGVIPARYETQLDLPAGKYTLKLVLSDGSKLGRAEVPVTVDRDDGKQLAVSSILLCKRFRDAATAAKEAAFVDLAPKYVPFVSKGVQFTPAGDMRFQKGEPLIAYFEIYEPLLAGTPSLKIEARLRITNVQTGELKVDTGFRDAASWVQQGSTVVPISEKIEVDKLPKGSYRLEVQAADSAGRTTIPQAITFTVE
jgi:hypothetical protein